MVLRRLWYRENYMDNNSMALKKQHSSRNNGKCNISFFYFSFTDYTDIKCILFCYQARRYHTKLNYKRDNIKRHSVARVIRSHIYPATQLKTFLRWNGIKYQCHLHHSSFSCVSCYRRKKEKANGKRTGDSKYKGKRNPTLPSN